MKLECSDQNLGGIYGIVGISSEMKFILVCSNF